MRFISLIVLFSIFLNPLSSLKVNAGVYNKLQQVGDFNDDEYFDSENKELSDEEKALEDILADEAAAELAAKERAKLEAEAKAAKEEEILTKAQALRDQEIELINEKFQTQKEEYEAEANKCGFFCKVWKVITYPVRKVASVF